MTMFTQFIRRPSVVLRQPFLFGFVVFAVLVLFSFGVGTDPLVNLWSLRYLWTETGSTTLFGWDQTTRPQPPVQHVNGHIWQARAALQQGNLFEANKVLQPALAVGSSDAQRLLAEIHLAQNNYANAIDIWVAQGDVESLLTAGLSAAQQHRTDDALSVYTSAYQLAPERTVLSFAHFLWKEASDVNTAETLLRQYIDSRPSSRHYLLWVSELASLYHDQGLLNKAAILYEQLLTADPKRIRERIDLGWVYYERGDGVEAAKAEFERALSIDPNRGIAHFAMGRLYTREGQYDEADRWYALAIQTEPDASASWYLARGNLAYQTGKKELAINVFHQAEQVFPENVQLLYRAAWIYKLCDQQQLAIVAIEKALQLSTGKETITPNQDDLRMRAAQIYEWAGQLNKASEAYRAAENQN